ncbi:nucleotide-binding protein [Paraburkholderia sp. BL27I4N3]|uniref:nucleotide-binding protein n=1 Tax=Paraburkholderia sp. BL27I4N3 TaxID=1938805 RepID=UPI002163D995|nr:nucleotide-binding protein [Paraburkholderia sp. BL27I4N3]
MAPSIWGTRAETARPPERVFEHGYLIGKLTRDRVCALVKGDVETPNDISGVVCVKELRLAGYSIDMNGI